MFTPTLYEYDDKISLGTFKTYDEALTALGMYIIENGMSSGSHPAIEES